MAMANQDHCCMRFLFKRLTSNQLELFFQICNWSQTFVLQGPMWGFPEAWSFYFFCHCPISMHVKDDNFVRNTTQESEDGAHMCASLKSSHHAGVIKAHWSFHKMCTGNYIPCKESHTSLLSLLLLSAEPLFWHGPFWQLPPPQQPPLWNKTHR